MIRKERFFTLEIYSRCNTNLIRLNIISINLNAKIHFNMLFERPYNKLQNNTSVIWKRLSGFDTSELNTPLVKGKWTAIQHMVHLNKSERSFVILLTKALRSNSPLNGTPLKIQFHSLFYKAYLNLGIKIKAPKVIEPADEVFILEGVMKDFDKTRIQLYQILQTINREKATKFWVHHIYLKELRVKDLLDFMIFHQNHHYKTIRKYLR